jgi:hypothetical protein
LWLLLRLRLDRLLGALWLLLSALWLLLLGRLLLLHAAGITGAGHSVRITRRWRERKMTEGDGNEIIVSRHVRFELAATVRRAWGIYCTLFV